MTVYQIRDWNIHFENAQTRSVSNCSFVCVPNKQHGMGFSYVMDEKDGAAIYGIWSMILAACSQQRRPRQGWLTSNGTETGTPWGCDDMGVKFRRPASEIKRALDVLCTEKVAWIIAHGKKPDEPTTDEGGGQQRELVNLENLKKGPLQLRAERLMRRRPETPLATNEQRAFKNSRAAIEATTEDEWIALEKFYSAPQQETFHRTDLGTLLNNWNGEIDRAKAWLANPTARKPKVPLTDQLKALESLITEHPCNPESIRRTGNETDTQRQEYRKLKADRDAVKKLIAAGGIPNKS